MQFHEVEKGLDQERQKNKEGGLALETMKKRAEEDRIRAEEAREKDKREKEEIKRREEDRVRHVEEEKRRLEVDKERRSQTSRNDLNGKRKKFRTAPKPNSSGSEIYYRGLKKTGSRA